MYRIVFRDIIFYSNLKIVSKRHKLILFHGLGCDAREFLSIFKNKAFKFQILIPVIPGHSNTSLSFQNDPLLDFARTINLFLKKKRIFNFTIYAHSMGNIIAILLIRNFYRKKCELLINNEGNLLKSDAGIVTRKTISYKQEFFSKIGYEKLIKKCKDSDVKPTIQWAKSLERITATNFYNYCKFVVYWSEKNSLLGWANSLFKKKVYLSGEYSKNDNVYYKIKGYKKILLSKIGHFPHYENKNDLVRIIYNEIKNRKK